MLSAPERHHLLCPSDSQYLASLSHSLALLLLGVYEHEHGREVLKSRSPAEQRVGLAAHAAAESRAVTLCFVKFSCMCWFVRAQPSNEALEASSEAGACLRLQSRGASSGLSV